MSHERRVRREHGRDRRLQAGRRGSSQPSAAGVQTQQRRQGNQTDLRTYRLPGASFIRPWLKSSDTVVIYTTVVLAAAELSEGAVIIGQ